jgi:transcriptional regulator with XRE-family HTH domain
MKRHSAELTQTDCAEIYGVSERALTDMRKNGAPVKDPIKMIAWWTEKKKTPPPAGLLSAAAKQEAGEFGSDFSNTFAGNSIDDVEATDIEEAAEMQRRNFTMVQRQLDVAHKKGSDPLIELWQGRLDKTALSLSRLEKIANEVRHTDQRYIPIASVRTVFNELHSNLCDILYQVAQYQNPEPTLRKRWDDVVSRLLEEPFPDAEDAS